MRFKSLLKRPLFILLTTIALASFLGSALLTSYNLSREIQPQSLPKPTFDANPSISLKFLYNGQLPQLEGNHSVYKSSDPNQSISESSIASYGLSLGFEQTFKYLPGAESDSYVFNKPSEGLIVSTNPNTIEYGNYNESQNSIKLKQDEYIPKVLNFLKISQLLSDNWSLDKGYVQLMITDGQGITIPTQNPTEAKYVEVKFNYLIDNKPMIDKQYRGYPIKILMNLDGSIKKATILLPPSNIQEVGRSASTTPQQALQAINAGQGTFTSLNNPEVAYTEIRQGDMESATFNSVELVYVYDYDTGSIQPFYRFQGYGYTTNGDKIEVGVIITALPQDVYQK